MSKYLKTSAERLNSFAFKRETIDRISDMINIIARTCSTVMPKQHTTIGSRLIVYKTIDLAGQFKPELTGSHFVVVKSIVLNQFALCDRLIIH